MKKNIKKLIFSLVMAVGLALGTAAVCSFAAQAKVGDIFYIYNTDTKVALVTRVTYSGPDHTYYSSYSISKAEIPSKINVYEEEYTVNEIGASAFYNSPNLQNVVLPPSVTKVGSNAFGNCHYLENVFLSSGTTVNDNAFYSSNSANAWRYRVKESDDDKTHVIITSVKNKDESDITTPIPLACNAMGDNYVIDAVECCAEGNATDGWTVYGTHTLIKTEAVEPTCTEAGNTEYYTCSHCGKHFSDENGETEIAEGNWVVPSLGHNMTAHVAVAATCTEDGNTEYWTCDRCGKYFSDENGETEIAEGDWVVPATGHTWSNWMPDPDNTENHKRTCTVCEAVQTEPHNWGSPEVTKEVTDTEDGEMKYVCKTCGAEKVEEVPALENYVTDPLLKQTVNKDGEQINCIVQDPYKVLPEGVRLEIKLAEGERYDELNSQLDPTHPIENVAFFDIKLYAKNEDEVEYELHGLDRKVRVLLQIPEGWDKEDMEAVLIAEDADIEFEEDVVTIDGVDYVAFWTNHFSPYATIDELTEEEARAAAAVESAESNKEADSTEESGSIETGDEINSYIMLEMVLFLASASLFVALRRRQKILLNEKK